MSQKTKKEAFQKPPFFISYFITDPIEFGNTSNQFETSLRNTFENHTIDMVCFRDKISSNKKELAKICLRIAREYNIERVLINSDLKLCKELGFDGIHLNSKQFDLLDDLQSSYLFVVISCHDTEEIELAKRKKADAITYSPIFFKELKGKPKGLDKLKDVVDKYQNKEFKIIGLGGIINDIQVSKISTSLAAGFASIRYFKIK